MRDTIDRADWAKKLGQWRNTRARACGYSMPAHRPTAEDLAAQVADFEGIGMPAPPLGWPGLGAPWWLPAKESA